MPLRVTLTWRRLVIGGLASALAGIAAAGLVAASGVYNVAASRGHPFFVRQFLELGMRRSVKTHGDAPKAPDLTDPNLITLGASHFQNSCATCHGSPTQPRTPVSAAMLPAPPPLADKVSNWSDHELHWIVLHGLKYTGMPGWAGSGRDDEVWAVVAFLRKLPDIDEKHYRTLASGQMAPADAHPDATAPADAQCHGTATAPPTSIYVPRLAGQNAKYLENALHDYRHGLRESGIMEPVAAELPEEDLKKIARYFADLESPPFPTDPSVEAERISRGQRLALEGDGHRLASCASCHIASTRPDYPRLAGQSEVYLRTQLVLLKKGERSQTPAGKLMADIARDLSDQQAQDIAAFFASLPPPNAKREDIDTSGSAE